MFNYGELFPNAILRTTTQNQTQPALRVKCYFVTYPAILRVSKLQAQRPLPPRKVAVAVVVKG
jgi:hypothetical protein